MTAIRRAVNVPALVLIAALIGAWHLGVSTKLIELNYIPLPSDVFRSAWELLNTGDFYQSIAYTLGNALFAVAIAIAIALPVGILLAVSPIARTYSMASLDVLRSLPLLALMPLTLLVWGPSRKAEIVIATFAASWPVLLNVMGGVMNMPRRMIEVALVFKLSRLETARKILVPATLTATVVGVRLAIVVSFLVTLVAEMLVSGKGMGWDLLMAQSGLDPARLWAWAVFAGFIGYVLNVLLQRVIRWVYPYFAVAESKRVA